MSRAQPAIAQPGPAGVAAARPACPDSTRPGPGWCEITDADGVRRTFHVLDSWTGADRRAEPVGTLLCVHGNPTWSYLWRRLLAAPPPGWRVIAPDQLGMGYSERIDRPRVLAQRVDDLGRLTDALGVTGPVGRTVASHDWGGIISLGWAAEHREQLRGCGADQHRGPPTGGVRRARS